MRGHLADLALTGLVWCGSAVGACVVARMVLYWPEADVITGWIIYAAWSVSAAILLGVVAAWAWSCWGERAWTALAWWLFYAVAAVMWAWAVLFPRVRARRRAC
jgi:hypothetical protein